MLVERTWSVSELCRPARPRLATATSSLRDFSGLGSIHSAGIHQRVVGRQQTLCSRNWRTPYLTSGSGGISGSARFIFDDVSLETWDTHWNPRREKYSLEGPALHIITK